MGLEEEDARDGKITVSKLVTALQSNIFILNIVTSGGIKIQKQGREKGRRVSLGSVDATEEAEDTAIVEDGLGGVFCVPKVPLVKCVIPSFIFCLVLESFLKLKLPFLDHICYLL